MPQLPPTPPQTIDAILSAVTQLPTITAGEETYLSSAAAIEAAANILYPDGIQTEEAYGHVCQATAQACAALGFGGECFLTPPAVPFDVRGNYRKRMPAIDADIVREVLGAIKPTTLTVPVEAIGQASVLSRAAYKCWVGEELQSAHTGAAGLSQGTLRSGRGRSGLAGAQ
jgi:hypothetical protein